MLCLI